MATLGIQLADALLKRQLNPYWDKLDPESEQRLEDKRREEELLKFEVSPEAERLWQQRNLDANQTGAPPP